MGKPLRSRCRRLILGVHVLGQFVVGVTTLIWDEVEREVDATQRERLMYYYNEHPAE